MDYLLASITTALVVGAVALGTRLGLGSYGRYRYSRRLPR